MIDVTAYKNFLQKTEKPFAFVNLDAFDKNLKELCKRSGNKDIRVATKSIRSTYLLKRIAEKGGVSKWMCFTQKEAIYLSEQGFDNLLVAYPSVQKQDVDAICQKISEGKNIVLMADTQRHLQLLNAIAASRNVTLPIAMDIDVSYDFLGIHFGVYRSSLFTIEKIDAFLTSLKKYPNLKLTGVMTYEAQIAGVGDQQEGKKLMNNIISFLKKKSLKHIENRRKKVKKLLEKHQLTVDFFNGGGTGSLETTSKSGVVTEVTFGSGLFQPKLFDTYKNFSHAPASGFVLEVCRHPQKNIYTCLGGGYIASGSANNDKLPTIVYPKGAKLIANEGAGEVQTPFKVKYPLDLESDNFAILRHAKSGELCERFNELYLLSNGENIGKINTYRGDNNCFL